MIRINTLLTVALILYTAKAQTCTDKHHGECATFNSSLPNFCGTSTSHDICARFCGHCKATLQCYSCSGISNPTLCYQTETCSNADQLCIVVETVTSTFDVAYSLGCSDASHCINIETAPQFGRRKRYPQHACCTSDLCNNHNPYGTPDITTQAPTKSCSVQMNGDCPVGFMKIPHLKNCYQIGTKRYIWQAAKDHCEAQCSHLARIVDATMEHDLSTYIHNHEHELHIHESDHNINHGSFYWLDGVRSNDEHNKWLWNTTGSEITYFKWHPGSPDDIMGYEDCIVFGPGEGFDRPHDEYYWNDRSCRHEVLALCEYDIA